LLQKWKPHGAAALDWAQALGADAQFEQTSFAVRGPDGALMFRSPSFPDLG